VNVLCVSAAAVLGIAACPAAAADWRFIPVVSSGVDYVENPRLLADDDGEPYASMYGDISADLSFNTEVTSISLAPRLFYAQYDDDPLLDRNEKYLTLSARRLFETVSWTGSASFTRDTTTTSEFGLTGLQNVNRPRELVALSLGPTWQRSEQIQVGAQVVGQETKYRDAEFTGLVDYRYGLATINGTYLVTENIDLGAQVSVGELQVPDTGVRSRNFEGSISLDWQLAEQWHAQLAYGPSRTESDAGDAEGYIYSASLTKQSLRSTVQLGAKRDVSPTGRGLLVTRDQASVTATYAITPHTTCSLTAAAIRTTDTIEVPGVADDTNEFVRLESSLRWRLAEYWSLVAAVGARSITHAERSRSAEGFNVSLGLAWQGAPRSVSR
jgi:hypothetical protein